MTTFTKTITLLTLGFAISLVACGGKQPPPKAHPDADLMDADGDGVGDKEDKCPQKKEDKQAPNPNDGCPKDD